MAWQGL
ncbi:hypothetical protein YPPY45_3257, partial [Yersinia pestis PY-45]